MEYLIPFVLFIVIFVAIFVAISRWVFRINHIIDRLDIIINLLKAGSKTGMPTSEPPEIVITKGPSNVQQNVRVNPH